MSNSNTNSTFSFDAWEKSALSELDTLQNHVSKALMKYQSNTDKTALGESANRYMGELRTAVTRIHSAESRRDCRHAAPDGAFFRHHVRRITTTAKYQRH